MPRKRRLLSETNIYHVVIKGTNSQLLFEERKDYLKYLDILAYQKTQCNFQIYAYCLMSNHVHLLIQSDYVPIDILFKKINTTYSCWFNMKYKRFGPLQDGRYYSEPVDNIEYFMCALRYIHLNPVKAGLEEYPGEKYEWCSYNSYVLSPPDITDTTLALEEFGDLDSFVAFHNAENQDDCLDVHKIKVRIPDDVAMDIIKEICNVQDTTDVAEFNILERNKCVRLFKERGVSARQINRLTGIPRGIVDRIIENRL